MAVQPLFYDLLKKLNEVKETTDQLENTRLTDDEKEFHSHRRAMDVYAVKEIVVYSRFYPLSLSLRLVSSADHRTGAVQP